jgi:hypothetical protein
MGACMAEAGAPRIVVENGRDAKARRASVCWRQTRFAGGPEQRERWEGGG